MVFKCSNQDRSFELIGVLMFESQQNFWNRQAWRKEDKCVRISRVDKLNIICLDSTR
jgi:hypothetical protein